MVTARPPQLALSTAAVLLVGNELLTGKIRDENGHYIAKMARRRGIRLIEICTVMDDREAIVQAIRRLVRQSSLIFTSGGVGPTHDDLTLPSLAAAFDLPLHRDPAMEQLLREHFGAATNEAVLRMADVPQGTTLLAQPGWPALRMNVRLDGHSAHIYVLPGVPSLFRRKVAALEALPNELPAHDPWEYAALEIECDETEFADELTALGKVFVDVEIGSYPSWQPDAAGNIRVCVRVTFEAQTPGRAVLACQNMAKILGPRVRVIERTSDQTCDQTRDG